MPKRGWDKSPSLSIIFGLSSKTQWLSGLYCADFISFYSPTQLCGGGTTKSNSNELPISVSLSFCLSQEYLPHIFIYYNVAYEVRTSCTIVTPFKIKTTFEPDKQLTVLA